MQFLRKMWPIQFAAVKYANKNKRNMKTMKHNCKKKKKLDLILENAILYLFSAFLLNISLLMILRFETCCYNNKNNYQKI
jgi:hypothetical protein